MEPADEAGDGELSGGLAPVSQAIFRVARIHKMAAGRLLREAGLYPGQELVMMRLWSDGPQRQLDLARALESDAPTMTRSLARLEQAGLVSRTRSPDDGRAMIVRATPESLRLRPVVVRIWSELEALTVGELSARAQNGTVSALRRLEANLVEARPSVIDAARR